MSIFLQKAVTVLPVSLKNDFTFSLKSNSHTPFLIRLSVYAAMDKKILIVSRNKFKTYHQNIHMGTDCC